MTSRMPIRRWLAGALAAAMVAATLAAQEQDQPTFRGGGDVVRVFATVIDGSGRLVTNLVRDNFEIRDEGKPQPITVFDSSPTAIRLIVLLDVSGSMYGNLPILRTGTTQLVRRLRQDDRARVGTFGTDIVISEKFTRDANELLASLPKDIDRNAPTPLWRAMEKAMASFGPDETDAREVVLVLSDGRDSGLTSFKDKFVTQGDVIDRARRDDVMIYAIGLRSTGVIPSGFGVGSAQAALLADLPDPGLAKVAEETGGGYVEVKLSDDLGAAFAQVADELHSQYLLGFDPPKRDGKTHKLELKTTDRNLKPRARKSYVAPKDH
jgi:Ca-activated chloride channel family protein